MKATQERIREELTQARWACIRQQDDTDEVLRGMRRGIVSGLILAAKIVGLDNIAIEETWREALRRYAEEKEGNR